MNQNGLETDSVYKCFPFTLKLDFVKKAKFYSNSWVKSGLVSCKVNYILSTEAQITAYSGSSEKWSLMVPTWFLVDLYLFICIFHMKNGQKSIQLNPIQFELGLIRIENLIWIGGIHLDWFLGLDRIKFFELVRNSSETDSGMAQNSSDLLAMNFNPILLSGYTLKSKSI